MHPNISFQFFPIGPAIEVQFLIENEKIHSIRLNSSLTAGLKWCINASDYSSSLNDKIYTWLEDYVQKRHSSVLLPLHWPEFSPFTLEVIHALISIPLGNTISYKYLAQLVQHEQAYRAVGAACGKNPFPLLYPCHRVIASNQELTGYAFGLEVKKRLLDFECPGRHPNL